MRITWNTEVNAPGCPGEIVADDGRALLIQTDWDYPGTASSFGWSTREVQKCAHRADFDFSAECGILVCDECQAPFYPMEVENGECPECGEHCSAFKPCDHGSTDGTVDCQACGCTASDFISAAGDWLRDNDGATADDPGYFGEFESRIAYFNRFAIELPLEAIGDMPSSGDCTDAIEHWAPKIARPADCTPDRLAAELKEYGAWDSEELADDAENWLRIIWIAACNLKDERITNWQA